MMMNGGDIAALMRRFACLLFLLFAAGPASAQSSQRIIAVGDLHGDYKAWQDIARAAGIIDARGRWAGGKTILVQLGDILDRGADSLKIVRSLQQLQREAPRRGGKVYVVLGNHEAMNLIGDDRYVTAGEYAAFADSQSSARRDRVYEANRASLEAAYRAQNPKITPEQVRATGWPSIRSAGSSIGWHGGRPAISANGRRKIPPSSSLATPCSCTAGSAPNMHASRWRQLISALPPRWRPRTIARLPS